MRYVKRKLLSDGKSMKARSARLIVDAVRARKGIAAFNAVTLEHIEGIVAGAEQAGRPVIVQLSQNAIAFHDGRLRPLVLAAAAIAEDATQPVAVHLDHVADIELLSRADGLPISSVMIDASALPYDENIAATAAATAWAHDRGWYVEAELGEVGGKDGAHTPGARTDPAEARAFVAATRVDALAVAVGSSHAMRSRSRKLDHTLIRQLRDALPVPLVLHGSSGVPDDELRLAVRNGITKVNIGTLLNIEYTTAVRNKLSAEDIVDPRIYLAPARAMMTATVDHLIRLLASPDPASTR